MEANINYHSVVIAPLNPEDKSNRIKEWMETSSFADGSSNAVNRAYIADLGKVHYEEKD